MLVTPVMDGSGTPMEGSVGGSGVGGSRGGGTWGTRWSRGDAPDIVISEGGAPLHPPPPGLRDVWGGPFQHPPPPSSWAPNSLHPPGFSSCSNVNGLSRESSRDDLASMGGEHIFEYEERFRVDRRKLELMMLQRFEAVNEAAADFFNRIGEETGTTVIWPSRLKIGAKSKKDPHIRVGGNEEGVKRAKSRIMEYLDNKTNRVTMKMDVSYTDHSHVIGKGGNTIRRVMAETSCHIHFPDSNRSNPNEKSNQVSIAGELEGVEKARARVRELTPLVFNFDLPIIPSFQSAPDPSDPYLRAIQDQYNIQIMFRQKQKNFHTTTVVVKGCEWEGSRVKEATLLLIEHLCQTSTNISVAMNMEISPQHHSIVLGKGNITLKIIMQRTNTTILFPDAGDPNIPAIRKGSVTITGAIHNVYLARQQLVGSLPLVMMFDLPDNLSIDDALIRKLQEDNEVSISIKPKARQINKAVIIKAQERNATGIYKTRKELLNLHDQEPLIAVIPESYKIHQSSSSAVNIDPGISLPVNHRTSGSSSTNVFKYNLNNAPNQSNFSTYSGISPNSGSVTPSLIPPPTPTVLSTSPLPPSTPFNQASHNSISPNTPWAGAAIPSPTLTVPPPPLGPQNFLHGMTPNHPYLQEYAMLVLSNISRLQQRQQQQQQQQQQHQRQQQEKQLVNTWIQHTSPQKTNETDNYIRNDTFLGDNCISSSLEDSPPLNGASPRNSSPVHINGNLTNNLSKLDLNHTGQNTTNGTHSSGLGTEKQTGSSNSSSSSDFTQILGELSDIATDRRAPGCEMKSKLVSQVIGDPSCGRPKPRRLSSGESATSSGIAAAPATAAAWPPGLGFSRTERVMRKALEEEQSRVVSPTNANHDNSVEISSGSSNFEGEDRNKFSLQDASWGTRFGNSSTFDTMNNQILLGDDLPAILTREGLAKYTDIFLRHEIDLQTFSTLTESDLKEIGIQTFGARKRILAAAMKVNKIFSKRNW